MPQNRQQERGSALLYVFIGLILFAGLIFTFSKTSSYDSGSAGTTSQDRIRAQAVIDYAEEMSAAVNKMLAKGISESDLSFENTVMENLGGTKFSPAGKYPNCTSDECKVFSPAGGNVVARRPLSEPVADEVLGANSFYTLPGMFAPHIMNVQSLGSAGPELLLTFHGLSKGTCAEINTLLGNNFTPNPPVGDDTMLEDDYIGIFTGNIGNLGDADDPWASGVAAQCHEFRTVPGFYIYQKVAIVR